MDNLENWKNLQEEEYFENHPLYDCKTMGIPHCVEMKDIEGKSVVDLGCGYGRDTLFFSKYAKFVYGIDVSNEILRKAHIFIGDNTSAIVHLLSTENYKVGLPDDQIDYVYALHVFQHLTLEQTKDYINTFYSKLKKGGIFNAQFYIGTDKYIEEGKEPRMCYTKEEALNLFKKYRIEKTWTLNKYKANGELQYEHFYIIGVK